MKRTEIKKRIQSAEQNTNICVLYFNYAPYCFNLIPLLSKDKLFLCALEDDFILDGYTIRRFKDVIKAKVQKDLCDIILEKEGIVQNLITPDIDISEWKSVFQSLEFIGRNIIVEKETFDGKDDQFIIGRIEKIGKHFVSVWNFDADGIWNNSPTHVPYSEITSVTFDSRYVTVFSKYICDPPFER